MKAAIISFMPCGAIRISPLWSTTTKFMILDISDVQNIKKLDSYRGKTFDSIFVEDYRAYVMEEAIYSGNEEQPFFYIFDVTNPNRIKKLYHNERDHPGGLTFPILITLGIIVIIGLPLFLIVFEIVEKRIKKRKKRINNTKHKELIEKEK